MSKASIIGAYNTEFGAFVRKDKATGLITDMNEPLGTAAGNALEVELAVDFLTGRRIDPPGVAPFEAP